MTTPATTYIRNTYDLVTLVSYIRYDLMALVSYYDLVTLVSLKGGVNRTHVGYFLWLMGFYTFAHLVP